MPTANAKPASKARTEYERETGPKKIRRDDLRCCNCATCEKELVGPSHREQAHYFGMMVATYVNGRPYCPTCRGAVLAKTMRCSFCSREVKLHEMSVQGFKLYCQLCAEPSAEPWRYLFNKHNDRHATTRPADAPLQNGTREQALAAGDME